MVTSAGVLCPGSLGGYSAGCLQCVGEDFDSAPDRRLAGAAVPQDDRGRGLAGVCPVPGSVLDEYAPLVGRGPECEFADTVGQHYMQVESGCLPYPPRFGQVPCQRLDRRIAPAAVDRPYPAQVA